MKRNFTILSIAVVLIFSCTTQKVQKQLDEFLEAFPTANYHLRGHLMKFGEYKGDLSNLTYDKYLTLLEQNEEFSTQGVAKTVKQSNQHYFVSKKNTFFIVIYSKKLNAVIFDNASTTFCDSIKVLKKNEPVPNLVKFIK
ncbi:MAG: hypothetical protein ABSD71_13475 [Bacteroidales bacterium]|jgi:hypothetical protein